MKQFRFKKAVSFLLAIAMVFTTLTVISTTEAQAATKVIQIKNVTGTTKTLNVGKTFTIKTNYTASKLTFKSSKPAIASVTSKGKITAKKAGTVKITITLKANKKIKKSLTIKVLKPLELTNIVDSTQIVVKGKRFNIKTTYKAADLLFESSDTNIATVSEAGKIEGVNLGSATITIKLKADETVQTSFTVVVKNVQKIIDGKLEETYHPETDRSDYRMYVDTMKAIGVKGYRTHIAFSVKGLASGFSKSLGAGKTYNETTGDYVTLWAIVPEVDHHSDISEFTDDVCKTWSKHEVANITRTETDTYYKLYFTYENIGPYHQYNVLDCILQDKATGALTEILFSFDKTNPNKFTEAEMLAIGESVTLEKFTADDLGK